MITAIKPIWNGKSFDVEVVQDADPLLAHNGFLVFDNAKSALDGVRSGRLIPSWSERKRSATVAALQLIDDGLVPATPGSRQQHHGEPNAAQDQGHSLRGR